MNKTGVLASGLPVILYFGKLKIAINRMDNIRLT